MAVHLALIIPVPEDAPKIESRVSISSSPKWNKLFAKEGVGEKRVVRDIILYTPLFKRAGLVVRDGRYFIPDQFTRQINAHSRTRYLVADTVKGISVEKYSGELKRSLFLQAIGLQYSSVIFNQFRRKTTPVIKTPAFSKCYNSRNTCCFQWLTASLTESGLLSFGTFPHPNCWTSKEERLLLDHKILKWYGGRSGAPKSVLVPEK